MKDKICIFWFRRDLRLEDNAGLCYALASGFPVLPIFIYDINILDKLENKKDRRVDYIHHALTYIHERLVENGSCLKTFYGTTEEAFKMLFETYDVQGVFLNRDYEPQSKIRDQQVQDYCSKQKISFHSFKDQVVFEMDEVMKKDGAAYTVYSPYAMRWKEKLTPQSYTAYQYSSNNFYEVESFSIHSLKDIGFETTDIVFEQPMLDGSIINVYDQYRDYPALQKTTQLGIALRFGTISIRQCVEFAISHNIVWLSELIWREFFMQILFHFPNVVHQSFKRKYDNIQWRNNEQEFGAWCAGKTGYPLVDAGMRQLNETGYMHNRVRMVVASFLCKHLLIDWRWGEAYFAEKLNDYDLSANNGNWQWAAGSGCDAAPYFRVFNPTLQTEKFDKDLVYVKRWLPEFGTKNYPTPIVQHSFARNRALEVYGDAVQKDD